MPLHLLPNDDTARALVGERRTRLGIDIVQASRIAESLAQFGDRFAQRIFTTSELAEASEAGSLSTDRLAACFAAKEAALKAFDLCESGIDWRDIEVRARPGGESRLVLHGKAAALADAADDTALRLSHDGDYALAIVAAPSPFL